MNRLKNHGIILLIAFAASITACNYVTFTPRSKKNVRKEAPSVILLQRIVEYREAYGMWPFTKEEFMRKGPQYYEAMFGLPYNRVEFKIDDINTMTFYFSEHRKDVENYKSTQKVDLNAYGGEAKFYKEGDKFVWKMKLY